jgi:hypothetical protein
MDTQLQTLVAVRPQGKEILIGKKLRQLTGPDGRLQWCWPARLDHTGNSFYVQLEGYSKYLHPVPFNYLRMRIREREADDPLILLLQSKGQDVTPFLRARAAPAPAPLRVPPAMAPTPMAGLQTPLPGLGVDPSKQNQLFQNAVMNIVQQGSLNDLMDSIIVEYETGLPFRAWRSKAKYLMAVYRKGDEQKAHLKAAIFFLATRLNFVSADLEYLAEAYIAEMNAAMQRAGSPASWTLSTVTGLEDLAREKYFDSRARLIQQCRRGMQGPCSTLSSPTGEAKEECAVCLGSPCSNKFLECICQNSNIQS